MKVFAFVFMPLLFLLSCSGNQDMDKRETESPTAANSEIQSDTFIDTFAIQPQKTTDSDTAYPIPPNGKYTYDMAFAEWEGKTMGVKVAVYIKEDSIKVAYEGVGSLSAEVGEVIDKGRIMKHKLTGEWIIAHEPDDVYIEEIGGCADGPHIIDFRNKIFWTC